MSQLPLLPISSIGSLPKPPDLFQAEMAPLEQQDRAWMRQAQEAAVADWIDHRAATRITPTQDDLHGLRQVVGTYMSLTTVDYLQGVQTRGWPQFSGQLWQRNYYEHVVRSDVTLTRIRQYVREKPAWWEFDRENPTVAQRPPQER